MTAYCPRCGQECTDVMNDAGGWCPDHGRVFVNWQRPMPAVPVLDMHGERIGKGMEIMECGLPVGLVTSVTGPDADYSDAVQRVVAKGPLVTVEYGNGDVAEFLAEQFAEGADYECRDLEVRT